MRTTEDKLEAIPAIALDVHNAMRAQHEQNAVERAQAELARGCEACDRPWRVHFSSGGHFRGCP